MRLTGKTQCEPNDRDQASGATNCPACANDGLRNPDRGLEQVFNSVIWKKRYDSAFLVLKSRQSRNDDDELTKIRYEPKTRLAAGPV